MIKTPPPWTTYDTSLAHFHYFKASHDDIRCSSAYLDNHSYRMAASGSTFVARRAGIQQASKPTPANSGGAAMNVSGSVSLTPNNKLAINRVSANEIVNPTPTPVSVRAIPCPITSFSTSLA